MYNDTMKRTTVLADDDLIRRLKALARDRGVSFAHVVREALEEKAREHRPRPRSLGVGDSGRRDVSRKAGVGRVPPRSWR